MRKNLLLLFFTLFSFSAIHAEITSTLSDDGTLTISGTGNMPDYSDGTAPWYNDRKKIKTVVIEDGVTSIGLSAFEGCSSLTSVTIGNSVTSIGYCAFWECSGLTSITIPNSVKSIGYSVFYGCSNLTSVTIGNSVASIGDYAFYYCSSLTSVTIPNSVTSIGKYAFYNSSSLASIIVEEGNTEYDSRDNCNAIIETKSNTLIVGCKNTVIPNSVTSIGVGAFRYSSSLTSITIPNSVTSIGGAAFAECSGLRIITIPNSVTSIGEDAFAECSGLRIITIPNSVTSIGSGAFAKCTALTSITIPNSVTSIGENAFYDCSGLRTITIPNSVTSIGRSAFYGCSGLTSITFERSTPPEFGKKVFDGLNKSIPVYVPFGSIEAYKNALEGQGFSSPNIKPLPLSLSGTYTQKSQVEDVDVSYTRNFSNTKWQALYLPFSLKYEDWKDDFEIAYINAIRQKDNNDDGKIDETILEFIKMNSGSTAPNTPYIIRAKEKGEKTLSAKNTTVYPAENNSVDCTTTTTRFTFTGIYKAITASYTFTTKQYYVLDGEKFSRASVVNYPKAYQWYMEIKSRNSSYATYNAAKDITISVLGEEEATGISQMQMENRQSSVYDINGRMVNENSLKPGMYIKNGRKVIIK